MFINFPCLTRVFGEVRQGFACSHLAKWIKSLHRKTRWEINTNSAMPNPQNMTNIRHDIIVLQWGSSSPVVNKWKGSVYETHLVFVVQTSIHCHIQVLVAALRAWVLSSCFLCYVNYDNTKIVEWSMILTLCIMRAAQKCGVYIYIYMYVPQNDN